MFLLMQSPNWYTLFFLILCLLAKQESLVGKAHTFESEESRSTPNSATTRSGRLEWIKVLISSLPLSVPIALHQPSDSSHSDSGLSSVTSFAKAAVANLKPRLDKGPLYVSVSSIESLPLLWEHAQLTLRRPCETELSYLSQSPDRWESPAKISKVI